MDNGWPAKHAKGRENQNGNPVADLIFKEETYALIGMCFAVYRDKGCGFLEPVYQECTEIEFRHNRIAAVAKPALSLAYRGVPLMQTYVPDFVCYGKIIVELKSSLTTDG
jgi:GxxExxY protein